MARSATKPASKKASNQDTAQAPAVRPRSRRPATRDERSAERRQAILAAALQEFSARGYAATRLDDVARRAKVAKGTIYLYFADKETLFQELIRSEISPVVAGLEAASRADVPLRMFTERLVDVFVREIFGTHRKDVIRLVIAEGPRFPKLAEFYYREIISHIETAVRAMLKRAFERGELSSDALVRFPQLLVAPGLVAIIWNGLFDRFEPLDVRALMRAHLDLVLGERSAA